MLARACPECGAPNSEFNLRCAACEAPLPPISSVEPVVQAASGADGLRPGGRLGRYRLLERLGRGSMGTVWLAEARAGGRKVALKSVQLPSAALLPTLRREIRSLERLWHPGIVRILESGLQDGKAWYAMELVEGMTLRGWAQGLEAGPRTAAERWWTRSLAGITLASSTSARNASTPRATAPHGASPAAETEAREPGGRACTSVPLPHSRRRFRRGAAAAADPGAPALRAAGVPARRGPGAPGPEAGQHPSESSE